MDAFKIPGIYYFEYTDKETGKRSHIPSSPPWTTWSGLMSCPLESEYGQRLKKKCGGEVYDNEVRLGLRVSGQLLLIGQRWPRVARTLVHFLQRHIPSATFPSFLRI